MTRTYKDGSPMKMLLYINKSKSLEWGGAAGTTPMVISALQDPYVQNVPNGTDLVKA